MKQLLHHCACHGLDTENGRANCDRGLTGDGPMRMSDAAPSTCPSHVLLGIGGTAGMTYPGTFGRARTRACAQARMPT